ncbi:MAG: DUF4845 domain-containing protein [Pseudomonadota bacterium]
MRSRQTGITFIGWLFLLVPIAIVGYAGIRLVPVYLNYMKVSKTLKQTAQENKGETTLNVTAVRASIDKRFDIEAVGYPKVSDVVVARTGDTWSLSVDYEDTVPLFAGISLLVHFDKRVPVE